VRSLSDTSSLTSLTGLRTSSRGRSDGNAKGKVWAGPFRQHPNRTKGGGGGLGEIAGTVGIGVGLNVSGPS
jgi:hypothetical protein